MRLFYCFVFLIALSALGCGNAISIGKNMTEINQGFGHHQTGNPYVNAQSTDSFKAQADASLIPK